jgi:hypothetical protein
MGEDVDRLPGELAPGEYVRLPVSKREGRLPLPNSIETDTCQYLVNRGEGEERIRKPC